MDKPRILVAVDFAETSKLALDEAIRLAAPLGAELDLVHICPIEPASARDLMGLHPAEIEDIEAARAQLDLLTEDARSRGVTARAHFAMGAVVFGLLDLIERLAPTLVVAGSEGKGAMKRFLVGSVAETLVRRSRVPVLVVPSPRRGHAPHAAWSCVKCGHILGKSESSATCANCGARPAAWMSAQISDQPADEAEPHVADFERDELPPSETGSPTGLFATSPPGAEGDDVNPELRVRY